MALFTNACTPHSVHDNNEKTSLKPNVQISAPKGSFVKPLSYVNSTYDKVDYKVFLNANKGAKRIKQEKALLAFAMDFKKISFKLISDSSLTVLKTPLTLLRIDNHNNEAILRLRFQNNYYWVEYLDKFQPVKLFLDYKPEKFIITRHKTHFTFQFSEYVFKIDETLKKHMLNIGIIRDDLLRYHGLYVPKQILYIQDILIDL